jgi:hypothetical protein
MSNFPISGMTVEQAEKILHQKMEHKFYDDEETTVVEDLAKGVTAFIDERGIVESVLIRAPFQDDVKGIHIGDTENLVRKILGAPIEEWEPLQGLKWMTYSEEPFFRVDIDIKAGNVVERIYV